MSVTREAIGAAHGLAKDSVPITRNDLPTLKSRPDILSDSLVSGVLADLLDHLLQPEENLLVGEAV